MNQKRLGLLALAAVVVLVLGFWLNAHRNSSHDEQDGLLLPALEKDMGNVTSVTLRHGGAAPSVTLHKQGTQWTVAERNDYPAGVAKLRQLLVALSSAKILEEKTSNPANFPALGLDDPAQPSATGTEVAFKGTQGDPSIIVGKTVGQGNFVRRGGANTSFVVEPALSIDPSPASWIDTGVLDIPAAKIQNIELKPASGTGYVLHRATADGPFALAAVPNGRKALDAPQLAPSPNTLAGLTAEDVTQASTVDFAQAATATYTLTDGTVLTVSGASSAAGGNNADKHWVQIKSSKDEALNAKLAGRAVALASYRYDAIFRPLEQLLVPLPPPPAKDGPGAKYPPAGPASLLPPHGAPKSAPLVSPNP